MAKGKNRLVLIKGAGDIATGVAVRLAAAGFALVMTELAQPTAIRRTVSISRAITEGEAVVEGLHARRAAGVAEALELLQGGAIPVMVDPAAGCRHELRPCALVDAVLAKRNTGTSMQDAPVVIGVGPGFTAGEDCHAAVETMRGHHLGRVYYTGSPIPNTGIPGEVGGYGAERVMHAPGAGVYRPVVEIGQGVAAGQPVAFVGDVPVVAKIAGVLRGTLPEGIAVHKGMKCADVDPRCERSHCFSVSDKARSVGGGVLEALLHFLNEREGLAWPM